MELERELEKLRIQIDQLKVSYERYFLGLDRRQPLRKHEEIKQLVRKYRAKPAPRNTGLRFKLNSLISKFSSYDRYWERILKEMEDGRFSRDRYNMARKKRNEEMLDTYSPNAAKQQKQRRLRAEGGGPSTSEAPEPQPASAATGESETVTAQTAKPLPADPRANTAATTTAKAVPRRRPGPGARADVTPPAPPAGKAGGNKLDRTYKAFLAARKKTGESNKALSYNKVMKQFEKKIPDFKKRHQCRDVEFKVVIKDGKAKIKAVPIK